MKCYLILSAAALAAGSAFSNNNLPANNVENFVARAIDPKTMDPTRLSVLSVLKTAIPCSARYPEATGEVEEWYSKLPVDVKSLLPSLYPASSTGAASVSGPVAKLAVTDVFTAACSASGTTTTTTRVTVTKTVHLTGSATALSNTSTITAASNGTTLNGTGAFPSPTNGILSSASPSLTSFTGDSGKMEAIAVFTWIFVFAVFVLFL
ncbi:hypothetical protein HBH98_208130 [Parastagonospora nodorum]|nr:hypothetical protein HBH52_011810 [Parastagonospora nodorum]KAH4110244.1 hypothetical protein HBH46_022980 [Parastagonospora nodorum]KAH4311139.1 hypothetical protein HBI01_020530 [Parastagonospora nodorum]KAH4317330.1 hypothetical protein HBI02_036870 [Parastagonospora nodorum]KAH4326722.1 hypothetical protein HBI00_140770 [Parastagonospora nodorum]